VLRVLRSLMPKEERFVDDFVALSGRIVAASDAMAELMAAERDAHPALIKKVSDIESEADVISRRTLIALHRAFITPFDRSDILALNNALDDAVDLIEEAALRAELYGINEFDDCMRKLGAMIQEAARHVAELMPLLTNISRNEEKIRGLCEKVSAVESAADRVLRQALSQLIAERPDAITFLGRKEVYDLLETVTDRCDDVADIVEGIVLDHV
jgi:predicted phosphate transport protein (TIGR00153 family)